MLSVGQPCEVYYTGADGERTISNKTFAGMDDDFIYQRTSLGEILAINRDRVSSIIQTPHKNRRPTRVELPDPHRRNRKKDEEET